MAEIVISITAKVAEYLVDPIRRQIGYLFNYHTNVEDLRNQVEKLGNERGRVERSVDVARRNGDEIEPDVDKWSKSVNGITEEAGKFLDDEDKAKKRCFNGLCPNLKSRYQLSKKAKKTTQEVVKFQGDGKFDTVSYPALPPQGIGSTSIKDYEAFESRKSSLKDIMEALKDPSINVIGVYGMGGVGKTMLVKEVARKAKEDKLFDKVVMAVVSQTPNLKKIQGEIADMLGMKFDWESESGRACQLSERLKKEKSILVILDDIWAKLDLEEVGIPFEDDHSGCKIVVTSRSQHVLSNEMDTRKNFGIRVLLEEEAWNLFKKMAGDSIEATDLKPTAIEVANECAGLPIAVAAVANALKNKSVQIWEDALQQLRSSTPTNINGMDAKVYSSLELSYKSLESEEAKSLFLLCSLFPEDYKFSIQDFLKYGKGLGLFQGINTLENARNRVHTLVHHLKASCLLLDSNTTGLIGRMHDVVRDVGIYVASKYNHMFIVRNGDELEDWTMEGKLLICRAISLLYSDIHELPTGLECPELKLLLLLSKDPSLKIPDNFFEGMKQLKVLNLTNMCFSSLPSSIHFLTNLQTLCLDQCVLRDITIIGELKKLEILSFQNSDIEKLPRERGQLTHLRMAEVKGCGRLKNLFSLSIARSLLQLEEIKITECKLMDAIVDEGREEEEDNNEAMDKIMFPQLRCLTLGRLPQLVSFCSKVKLSTTDAGSEEIISEGEHDIPLPFSGSEEIISESEDDIPISLLGSEEIISEVPFFNEKVSFPNLEELVISYVPLKEIWHYQLPAGSFCKLKHLTVDSCDLDLLNLVPSNMLMRLQNLESLTVEWCRGSLEYIFDLGGLNDTERNVVRETQLRDLDLHDLPILTHIWKKDSQGIFPFQKLSSLEVNSCPCLWNIFTTSIAKSLVQLQELSVRECEMVEEIVEKEGVEEEAADKIVFPQLTSLTLEGLGQLKSFCQGIHISEWPSLKKLKVSHCYNVDIFASEVSSFEETRGKGHLGTPTKQPLFLVDKIAFPNLEELKLGFLSSMKEIWQGQFHAQLFCKLRVLKISRCDEILKVFPINFLQNLQNLEKLSVKFCSSLEIIANEEGEATDETTFSQLTSLELKYLPNLTSFCQGSNTFSFPSLEKVLVKECPKLKTFSNRILSTPKLEKVQVQEDEWIWEGDLNTTIQHLFIRK